MSQPLHFESSFWGQKFTGSSVPDYQAGLRILHEKLAQSRTENDEIIAFLRDRVSVEESYGVKLTDQGQQRQKPKGFLRDEGATLRKGFDSLRAASELLGSQHMELALNIHEVVLKPLIKLSDDYKSEVGSSKRNIDMKFKQFENGVKDVERHKNYYVRKCREADRAEELALTSASETAKTPLLSAKKDSIDKEVSESGTGEQQSPEVEKAADQDKQPPAADNANVPALTFTLAGQVYSATEFDSLITKMRQEIAVTEHKVPIFGTYQNTSTGENIARWLQQNITKCKDSPATADLIGQQLISSYHMLKLIGQLGDKFVPSSHHVYQWKTTITSPEANANASAVASSALEGVSGILGKFGSTIASNASNVMPGTSSQVPAGEEPHKLARRDAELADAAYLKAVRKLDNIRLQLEQMLFSHFSEMEQLELNRISSIKRAFIEFGALMSNTLPTAKAIYEQMLLYQQTLKPEQDIQYIIQQYFVSGFAPKAVLYENFYHGHALDQSFAVSLVDIGKNSDDGIPRIVKAFLSTFEESEYILPCGPMILSYTDIRCHYIPETKNLALQDETAVWTTPVPLDQVHVVRNELNLPSSQLTDDVMSSYDIVLLAGTFRLYLRELPESVITSELYEGIKALYASEDQDEAVRLQSIAKLLATMPTAHYNTLKALTGYFDRKIKAATDQDGNEFISRIGQSFGPLLLWPRYSTFTTTNDRQAAHLIRDLLTHHDTIFSNETNAANAENEKRRLETPVTLQDKDSDAAAAEPTSPTIRRGLMSFVRSSAPEDVTKRMAGSVFGTFNRSGPSESSSGKTPGNKFSTSVALSSPPLPGKTTPEAFIIGNEKAMTPSAAHDDEEPDIMFDATEEQEQEKQGSSEDHSKAKTKQKVEIEGEMGEADTAEAQLSSADLLKEIDNIAPGDKEGNDIDPFFEDD